MGPRHPIVFGSLAEREPVWQHKACLLDGQVYTSPGPGGVITLTEYVGDGVGVGVAVGVGGMVVDAETEMQPTPMINSLPYCPVPPPSPAQQDLIALPTSPLSSFVH